ncbi:hypothetical protein UFOVP1292_50 [uncultured Caudovirales phage]|uniref:Uncharacterized protein n=1 Tax=uncultured Caudovirales phage TaxID=2100421 RepID=A0A6J5P9G7_9CAUD|nr:hypothetical protein UFOVP859_45 [uncultured Caudovirales phage]CAB4168511.1 hypothetical protein UFOVP882_43 [uncultured Caudovirales phage]CAB4196446.1 hypothetical protein UFOVP1292_50 [uncultured Caudovirales phage]CAB4205203.1 hypothetical protein UFOVP1411_41 [uncultured Caudovirales phage]
MEKIEEKVNKAFVKQYGRQFAEPGECASCDRHRANGDTFFPPHDASRHCRSGGNNHCSCDSCF